MNDNIKKQIDELTKLIQNQGDKFTLYYERGYLYFLLDDEINAKEDYMRALSYGLDPTECPFYTFSNTNSKRRKYMLPEIILLVLVLLIIGIALFEQILNILSQFQVVR